ncbi:MAG: mechanosensitive ion channel [Inquilinus sp.]|nr:mechanosensitive ion channel [Inquilinus sp.]
MTELLNRESIIALWQTALDWVLGSVLVPTTGFQALVTVVALLFALVLGRRLRDRLTGLAERPAMSKAMRKGIQALAANSLAIVWLVLQWIAVLVATAAGWPIHFVEIVASLLNAWVIINLTSAVIRDPGWARFVAVCAWTLAALNIVGLLDETIAILDGLAISLAGLRISALAVIKGVLSLAVLLWAATMASRIFERRISAVQTLTPSVQVLFSKLLKIVLITIAIVAALSSVGIDLTAFAVFSGAVGVGIGFGLQKVVSNLISGVILLLDKSVKPGDVINVGQTYGWINSLGARYASVVTRDGTEFLIPNEDLITQQVVNWSYSNNEVRLRLPIGISYNADVHLAIRLCLEAAAAVPRVVAEPKSACLLRGFGDSSVDLELRIWIKDPQNGISNVKSEVLLLVWEKFHEHKVEIPFPQRDLHLKPPAAIAVTIDGGSGTRRAAAKAKDTVN